jgi:SpoVK/Ycf46/Vps4 family AAA+-type ATPase
VGQLLQEMDGIQAHDSHVFLVAATNRFEQIDPAIRSRFSEKLVIPLPDREDRIRLLSILLEGKKINFPLTDGRSCLRISPIARIGADAISTIGCGQRSRLRSAIPGGTAPPGHSLSA